MLTRVSKEEVKISENYNARNIYEIVWRSNHPLTLLPAYQMNDIPIPEEITNNFDIRYAILYLRTAGEEDSLNGTSVIISRNDGEQGHKFLTPVGHNSTSTYYYTGVSLYTNKIQIYVYSPPNKIYLSNVTFYGYLKNRTLL